MPQLDPSSFGSQLFWLLLTFTALYVGMAFIALPRIGRTLKTREDVIAGDIKHAAELQEAAAAALADHEAALADARAQALTLAESVRREMREESDAQKAEVEARLAKSASEAEVRLQAARTQAMGGVRDAAIEIIPPILSGVGIANMPDAAAIAAAVSQVEEARQ